MHALLHTEWLGLFERGRRAPLDCISRHEREGISGGISLFHEVHPPSAEAPRKMPIPKVRRLFGASRQAHTVPVVSFLARIGRRQKGTGRNCPVVSRNRQGQSGVDRDTGKKRTGNADSVSTPLLRDLQYLQSLNESVFGGCERFGLSSYNHPDVGIEKPYV